MSQHDRESMAICAIRYCIGRSSYIVADGVRWALKFGAKSKWVRNVIISDLESAVKRCDRERAEKLHSMGWLGSPMDEERWRDVLRQLKEIENDQS